MFVICSPRIGGSKVHFWALSLTSFTLLATDARAVNTGPWDAAVARQCPSRHFERMGDGLYDEIIGKFEKKLSKQEQSRIKKIADYPRRCRAEIAGFSCELAVHVDAMRRLGLLDRFVAYGCSHYTCPDVAYCIPRRKGRTQ